MQKVTTHLLLACFASLFNAPTLAKTDPSILWTLYSSNFEPSVGITVVANRDLFGGICTYIEIWNSTGSLFLAKTNSKKFENKKVNYERDIMQLFSADATIFF